MFMIIVHRNQPLKKCESLQYENLNNSERD
jgi:hypothetical protein